MKESQLDNKTAIATNDYVRMVDENGNSVKIKKDSFMAAIRDALPSIISDGKTGGGSVLSIINGALKTRTDANLVSVMGALDYDSLASLGNAIGLVIHSSGVRLYTAYSDEIWTGFAAYILGIGSGDYIFELAFKVADTTVSSSGTTVAVRRKYQDSWSTWKTFAMV